MEMTDNPNYIKPTAIINWDEYFMFQAMVASCRSKDPVTKVGCVFVDSTNHQLSMGYNGFVAGIDETQLPWGKDKEQPFEHQKYGYVVHAEANAILHSPKNLNGSRCYVTHFPCHECAKMLASIQVSEVIYLSNKHCESESHTVSKKILDLAGVKYRQLTISSNSYENVTGHLAKVLNDL